MVAVARLVAVAAMVLFGAGGVGADDDGGAGGRYDAMDVGCGAAGVVFVIAGKTYEEIYSGYRPRHLDFSSEEGFCK